MTTELTNAAQQAHTPERIAGVDHAHELLRRMPEPDEPCKPPNEPPPETRPKRAKSSHKQNARKAQKRRK